MAFTPITVTRRYLNPDLTPATGGVTFIPQVPMINGTTVVAAPKGDALDAEGDLSITIAANDDPDTVPVDVAYLVREEIDHQRKREYYVVIPHDASGGTVDLSTLVTVQVPPVLTFPSPGPPGPAGEQGPTGATGPAGTSFDPAAPVANVGALPTDDPDGTARFVIDTRHMYVREDGDWTDLGELGIEGPQGPQGIQGVPGDDGVDGVDGEDGVDGRTLLNGTGAPGGGVGADGDFYIDTAADAIYGPKTSGAWGSPTPLVGPQGEPGVGGVFAVADATDFDDTGATTGDLVYVSGTGPLEFATTDPAGLPVSSATTTALGGKEPTISAGTTGQYWRGDKSWQTLNKTAVGLANVDNTADADKPVSSATTTALAGKEATITAGTTAQYWRGDKSWQTLNKAAVGLSNVDNTTDGDKPVSTATQTALDLKADKAVSQNTQTGTSYTLVLADLGKVVEMNNASSNTLTVPPNSSVAFPVGTIIELYQVGAGQTTVAPGSGVTVRGPNGLKLASQYASASLRKRATDEWVLAGDVAV